MFAGSVTYLVLAGNLMAGWQMARSLIAAEQLLADGSGDRAFLEAKVVTARFYAEHLLSKAPGLREAIVDVDGAEVDLDLEFGIGGHDGDQRLGRGDDASGE